MQTSTKFEGNNLIVTCSDATPTGGKTLKRSFFAPHFSSQKDREEFRKQKARFVRMDFYN